MFIQHKVRPHHAQTYLQYGQRSHTFGLVYLYLIWAAFLHYCLVNLPQPSCELINKDGMLQSIFEKIIVMCHLKLKNMNINFLCYCSLNVNLVHQFIENNLETDSLMVLITWEWRGKKTEWGKVESISVKFILLSHTNAMHQAEVLGLFNQVCQLLVIQRQGDTGLHVCLYSGTSFVFLFTSSWLDW